MDDPIGFDDIKRNYLSIAAARKLSGLRLVLGAYAVPGPWREACKALFHVKGLPYACVRTANDGRSDLQVGMDGSQSELIAWTAQASAPVAIWNDERPRASWVDQLYLAERLQPEPALIPPDIEQRLRMFGLINEIAGEHGIGWSKRVVMVHAPLSALPPGDPGRPFWETLAAKYGYTPAAAAAASARIVAILGALDTQLASQQAAGAQYMMGRALSALDLYWACFLALFKPLPPDLCPMATEYRAAYSNDDAAIEKALTTRLVAHRDFIYQTHLELPIVF